MSRSFNTKQFSAVTNAVKVFLNFAVKALYVLIGLLLLSFVVLMFIPKDLLEYNLENLEHVQIQISNIRFDLDEVNLTGFVNVKWLLVFGSLTAAINLALITFILRQLKCIVADVLNKKPFSENNVKNLKLIALTYIIMATILPSINSSFGLYFINLFNLSDFGSNYMIDFNALFMGLILFGLAGVFDYGSYLQEDYDMTV